MMKPQYTLMEIIRDPRMLVCEASEITRDGHYYLYRYNGAEGKFYRATVPSGAASTHFQVLETTDKIPLGGWHVVVRGEFSKSRLHLVTKKRRHSVSAGDATEKTLGNNKR
jgi:hypothetical protein